MVVEITTTKFDYGLVSQNDRQFLEITAQEIKTRLERTKKDLFQIGEMLIEVKSRLPHGSFGSWLATEFQDEFNLDERTAQRYMNVVASFKSDTVADLPIGTTALYILSAPSVPDEVREEAVERAKSGEPITKAVAQQIVNDAKPVPAVTPTPLTEIVPATVAVVDAEITEVSEPVHLKVVPTAPKTTEEDGEEDIAEPEEVIPEIIRVAENPVQNKFGCAACQYHQADFASNFLQFNCAYLSRYYPVDKRRDTGVACQYWQVGDEGFWMQNISQEAAAVVTPTEVDLFIQEATATMANRVIMHPTLQNNSYQQTRWQKLKALAQKRLEEAL